MYYSDGINWLEVVEDDFEIKYYLNEILHREDGPAVLLYDHNGQIKKEIYYINGSPHKENGPAIIKYYANIIEYEKYWFNGIEFDPEKLPFELPIDSEEKELYINLKYGNNNV